MKEFMYIFRNTLEAEKAFANLSPKEMEADMKNWNEWMGKLAQEGKLIGGQPLFPTGKVVRQGKKLTDGPFIEGKDLVGGYVIIKANDVDEAIKLSDGCPMFMTPTGSVEVREVMPIPQG
jgi:hypothetical protein